VEVVIDKEISVEDWEWQEVYRSAQYQTLKTQQLVSDDNYSISMMAY